MTTRLLPCPSLVAEAVTYPWTGRHRGRHLVTSMLWLEPSAEPEEQRITWSVNLSVVYKAYIVLMFLVIKYLY